jgi:hypothetical protein
VSNETRSIRNQDPQTRSENLDFFLRFHAPKADFPLVMIRKMPAEIEPCGIEENIPAAFTGLVLNVRSSAEALGRKLHPAMPALRAGGRTPMSS